MFKSDHPYAPKETRVFPSIVKLSPIKDLLTSAPINADIERHVTTLFDTWSRDPNKVEPFITIRDILDSIRKLPSSERRIGLMNSLVRVLGRPSLLATYLDMLRYSARKKGTEEQKLCKTKLQDTKLHSVYGWCGNTLLVESSVEETSGTYRSPIDLEEILGNPTAAWNLTIHIWQPNARAKGFPAVPNLSTGKILEPPHTHPFDFVSYIVKGTMHQSTYSQNVAAIGAIANGYYRNTILQHVDGVWPPHHFIEPTNLQTIEHRLLLKEGDSYYMPCDLIHDVEIESSLANTQPTITLFLSSEYLVMPHVYMSKSMLDFHRLHPNIKNAGQKISEAAWHEKLKAISSYLRGESKELRLDQIIQHQNEYAFFHLSL